MSTRSHHQVLLSSSPPVWTPANNFLSGERGVWIDPSDFSTLWQTDDTSTPVTATGQTVGLAHDKSGNGNHFKQPTSGNRPTLQQDGNGNYYLQFTISSSTSLYGTQGTSDGLYIGAGGLTTSIVSGVKLDSNSGFQSIIARSYSGSFLGRWWSALDSGHWSTGMQVDSTIDTINSGASESTAITIVSSECHRPSSDGTADCIVRVNASQTATSSGVDHAGTSISATTSFIGAYNNGTNPPPSSSLFFGGRIYGIVVRIAVFDSTLRDKTEDWMNGKCGAY